MAGPDLEALRRAYEAWSARDLGALLTWFDPAVEFRTSGAYPGLEPVYHGHEGVVAFWEAFYGA